MPLRFAIIGAGFWAHYQIPAWLELEGVNLVAICDIDKTKAETLAHKYGIPAVYQDVETLLESEDIDFLDVITSVHTHADIVLLAAKAGVTVICQKPMAEDVDTATRMVRECEKMQVPFWVHENFRWQTPIRKLKHILESGEIGIVFKGRVSFCSAFPVFDNQPFLAEIDKFIISDVGSHILDVCRFLFGEVEVLYCQTNTVNINIKGEDVANVAMTMKNGVFCFAEMSYASILKHESFPQTFVQVEGSEGSVLLTRNHELHVTTKTGTQTVKAEPPFYSWQNPEYALIHSSIVECNRAILEAFRGHGTGETTGEDNLKTVRLVQAAYASANDRKSIKMDEF